MRAELAALAAGLQQARSDVAAGDSILAAFVGPEVHFVSLSSPAHEPAARVVWNHTRNVFVLTAFDLPPAPEGRTYQLWAIAEGKAPVSMGTFDTHAEGRALAILPVGAAVVDAGFINYCGLTVEPRGGSVQPTESPRLIGEWRHVD